MTDEEKKAVEYFKSNLEMTKEMGKKWGFQEEIKNYETILNLLEKQDNRIKELESDKEIKDKMIELMVNLIYNWDAFKNYGSRKDIKQYFENLAKVNLQSNKENVDTEDFKQKYQCLWNLKSNKESGDENAN